MWVTGDKRLAWAHPGSYLIMLSENPQKLQYRDIAITKVGIKKGSTNHHRTIRQEPAENL